MNIDIELTVVLNLTAMKKHLLTLFFLTLICSQGFGQTYWNFIMDSCQATSYAMGTFWRNDRYCAAIQENEYDGINKLKIISWDDQFVRQDLNTSIELHHLTFGSYDGIIKIKNGYLLNTTYSNQHLLNFNDSLQLNWSINLYDSLASSTGIPAYWTQDSITGDLYGVGTTGYISPTNNPNAIISLVKLDSAGSPIFQRTYPQLLQNLPNYANVSGSARHIRFANDTIYLCGIARQSNTITDVQTYPIFCAKFDSEGNPISVDFVEEKTSNVRAVPVNSSYYFVNQEKLDYSIYTTETQLRIYYRETFSAAPQLVYEDPSLLTTVYEPLIAAIHTTEGILMLVDKSEDFNVKAQLIMYDTQTNSIAWQKEYYLELDTTQLYVVQDYSMGYLMQLPDSGFAFSGNIRYAKNYPWFIRTDVCGNEVAGDCIQNRVDNANTSATPTLSVFPNPFTENLTIKLNPNKTPTQLQIFNSVGQLIQCEAVNHRLLITLENLNIPSGVYIVQAAFDNDFKEQIKVIKN